MSKIYLAASYARKDEMRGCRDVLKAAGHEITSSWIDRNSQYGVHSDVDLDYMQGDPEFCSRFAARDIDDMFESEIIIMFTGDTSSSGGRHTEFGIAMCMNDLRGICIIGPRENVFQCHPNIYHYPDWSNFCIHMWEGSELTKLDRYLNDMSRELWFKL